MKALVLFVVSLSAGCLAQRPQQCSFPPLLSGSLSVSTQNEKLMAFAKYNYDALGQRIRLQEIGQYENQTFYFDVLLLYNLGVMYSIDYENKTCCKKPLNGDFHPLKIPRDASLVGQVVLGGSSGPRQGVLVNSWAGNLQMKNGTAAKYFSTVTEFGCIPVSNLFHTDRTGWMITSFFNNVIGLVDPQLFIPPPFCEGDRLVKEDGKEPVTFFSLFS